MRRALTGTQALAFFPAGVLAAYWIGREQALIGAAAFMPALVFALGGFSEQSESVLLSRSHPKSLLQRDVFSELVEVTQTQTRDRAAGSALFQIEVDDYKSFVDRHGQAAGDIVGKRTGERLLLAIRDQDSLARLGESSFALCLGPSQNMDLEVYLQIANSLQAAIEEPFVDGVSLYATISIGFCLCSSSPGSTGMQWMRAAKVTLKEAKKSGPSTIRPFSKEMQRVTQANSVLREEVQNALETGQIIPWFQPQVSTDTGKVTGFEALARCHHPTQRLIAPIEFLPAIKQAGLLERLAEVIIYHAFTAIKAWDTAGVYVPQVDINFSELELNNPRLIEKLGAYILN